MSRNDASEQEALLAPPPTSTRNDLEEENVTIETATANKEKEDRRGDLLALVVTGASLLVISLFTWALIARSGGPAKLSFFAVHPPAQTLAIFLFGVGILTLQPTRRPKSKTRGLRRHQLLQLGLGAPTIIIGASFMIKNKASHDAPHFTSWHGTFGLIALIWIGIQIIFGGASVWFNGRTFGGKEKGKTMWKWHRASGYLLFPFLLLTVHLAGGYADWVVMNTSTKERVLIYTLLPIFALIGLFARLRPDKLPAFKRSPSGLS